MRFRFCWSCDCPDWILAEILTLSKINPKTLKKFCDLVTESICRHDLNFQAVQQLLEATNFDEPTIKASTAALRWILSSAAGALSEAHILGSELEQLGLPKEQSEAVKEAFDEHKENMKKSLMDQSLKASGNVKWSYDIKGLQMGKEKEPLLQMNIEGELLDQEIGFRTKDLDGSRKEETVSFYATKEQVGALIHELEEAYKHMKEINPNN